VRVESLPAQDTDRDPTPTLLAGEGHQVVAVALHRDLLEDRIPTPAQDPPSRKEAAVPEKTPVAPKGNAMTTKKNSVINQNININI